MLEWNASRYSHNRLPATASALGVGFFAYKSNGEGTEIDRPQLTTGPPNSALEAAARDASRLNAPFGVPTIRQRQMSRQESQVYDRR